MRLFNGPELSGWTYATLFVFCLQVPFFLLEDTGIIILLIYIAGPVISLVAAFKEKKMLLKITGLLIFLQLLAVNILFIAMNPGD